jgi:O-antigen chain-terminating methyltransferase
MGGHLSEGTRLRPIKAALLRMSRLFARDQVRYNHEVLAMAAAVEAELDRVGAVEAELRESLALVTRERDYDHSELRTMRAKLERLAGGLPNPSRTSPAPAAAATVAADDFADFYREFEDEFRGSAEQIRERQSEYLADFGAFAGGAAPVVDIGCGRGEWLQLLGDNGIRAVGVDTNETFVRMCAESGLEAVVGDAVSYLDELEEGSVAGVTAFHVAEHLEPSVLMRMLDCAHRALKPGGVLVLETPNPTNLTVGAANFWSDLTHLKPLFPHTLAFLVRQRGFTDVDLRFLHPTPTENFTLPESYGAQGIALDRVIKHLNGWFFGPEDYAVVAAKYAP